MSKPDLLPSPPDPGAELIAATVNLDKDNLDWLDGAAKAAGRNRSDALREILRKVRASQGQLAG